MLIRDLFASGFSMRFDALHASAAISGASDARATVEITTGLDFDFSRQRLAPSMLSVKVPTYSVSGVGGQLVLNGVLDGDLRAGTFALKAVQSAGTMGDDRSPGDRRPFRFSAHLDLTEQLRTLTAKHLQLSFAGLQMAGELTLRAVQAPPGVRGNFDLTVEGQKLKGSVAVAEAGAGVDLHLDVTADLDIDDGRYGLRGSNAIALRARVIPTPQEQRYRVADLQLDAYLSDTSAADGRLPVSLRADLDVDLKNESIRSENLRLDVADNRIVGSVDVRRFGAPAVRFVSTRSSTTAASSSSSATPGSSPSVAPGSLSAPG